MAYKLSEFKGEWISEGMSEDTILFAQNFGEHLCDLQPDKRLGRLAMSTSQIRNFFGEVKRIQARLQERDFSDEKASFLLLKPKLAYAEARVKAKSGQSNISDFRKVIELAHAEVKNDKDQFRRFVDFLEAILAYHKASGGRE
jgi:CRISPR-associated protein Csm2